DFTVTNITDSTTPPGFTFNIKSTINPPSDVYASLSETFVPVEAGKTVTMKTTYRPIEVTTNNGFMVVESDVPIAAKKSVALTGTGSNPIIKVDPGSWNFGTMHVSTTQVPNVPVTITNDSISSLRLDSISLSGGADDRLVIDPNDCAPFPKTLPTKDSSCTFYIKFTPKSPGLIDRSISIASDAGDTVSVKLTGEVKACDAGSCDLGGFCDCMRILRGGDSCATAEDIKPTGASDFDDSKGYEQVVEGNLVKIEGNTCTLGDVRWFTFYASDNMELEYAQKRDPFYVRVILYKDSTGEYDDNTAMDVYTIKRDHSKDNPPDPNCKQYICGTGTSPDAICDVGGCTKMISNQCGTLISAFCDDIFEYRMDAIPTKLPLIGECGCKTVPADCQGKSEQDCLKNDCLNDSQRFYIKLYRKDSTPLTCKKYKLIISNGKDTECPFY
ncbi:MAG: choice-of-anchor D domain-containing protein, partial [Myxococcota bacterium]